MTLFNKNNFFNYLQCKYYYNYLCYFNIHKSNRLFHPFSKSLEEFILLFHQYIMLNPLGT